MSPISDAQKGFDRIVANAVEASTSHDAALAYWSRNSAAERAAKRRQDAAIRALREAVEATFARGLDDPALIVHAIARMLEQMEDHNSTARLRMRADFALALNANHTLNCMRALSESETKSVDAVRRDAQRVSDELLAAEQALASATQESTTEGNRVDDAAKSFSESLESIRAAAAAIDQALEQLAMLLESRDPAERAEHMDNLKAAIDAADELISNAIDECDSVG